MIKWTFRQAIFFLAGSTFATLVLFGGGYFGYQKWMRQHISDKKYSIVAIVQTGPEKEAVKTSYLAELLDLSADRPTPLYAFDIVEGQKKLLACPLIANATIQRISPGTLYIDYSVRKPIAVLFDYQNTLIDREGYLFPMSPFFSPKNLPEIYLGLPPFGAPGDPQGRMGGAWQMSVQNRYFALALDLLKVLSDAPWREGFRLKRIDVSHAFSPSAGLREIVLLTEEELMIRENGREVVCIFPKMIRLPTNGFAQQLGNFVNLRRTMMANYRRQISALHLTEPIVHFAPRIIDLRLADMALVQNN